MFSNIFQRITQYLYYIPAALLCISIHESAHGYVAYRLGDPTAKQRGRLTLNPLRHFDIFGFIMMVFAGFGWAKPVPVDMRYFRNPKRDMALVGVAGPLSNFILGFVCFLITSAMETFVKYSNFAQIVYTFFYSTAILSTGLGVFNLIPISPLDGSKIIGAFLPEKAYYTMLRYERYGMIVLMGLILIGKYMPSLDFFGRILDFLRSAAVNGIYFVAELPFTLFK